MSNAIVHAYRHKFYLRPILLHYLDETATLQFIIRVFDKLQVLLRNKCEVRIAKLRCQGKKMSTVIKTTYFLRAYSNLNFIEGLPHR